MGGIGIFLLFFIGAIVFIGLAGAGFYFIKMNDPNRLDTTNSNKLESAQDFLPFVDIGDQMIHMGNNVYHAVVEVSSINYVLRNDREKDIVELSFQGFLNSLAFPITLYISTRAMDYSKLVQSMKDDYERTYNDFPMMREYLQQNLIDMQDLSHSLGETRHKKKYVIVPYDASILTELDDEERYEATKEVLFERAQSVQNGLERISGINTKILDTIEIMDLFIQTYHRDGSQYADSLFQGNLTSIIVDSIDIARPDDFTEEELFDIMLHEMQATLESKFINNQTITNEMKNKASSMWERIHDIRQSGELDGLKINHQKEREEEFLRKIQTGEVEIIGNNKGFTNVETAKKPNGGEIL